MPVYTPNLTIRYIYTDFINVMNTRDFTVLNIYVNSVTGVDTGPGRGSRSSPYKSLKFALNDAFTLMKNSQVVIHLAGADPHILPDGFVFPAILSPDQVTTDPTPTFGFNKRAPLVLRAEPSLETTIAAPAVVAQTNNVNSGLKEIETTGGLVPGEFTGEWLQDASGVLARIFNNTATDIFLDYAGADLTAPFSIYSEGASIAPEVLGSSNPTIVLRGSTDPIIFFGIEVEASAGGAVQVGPGQQATFIACAIPFLEVGKGINADLTQPGAVECVACRMESLSLPAANLTLSRCQFGSGTFTNMGAQSKVTATACSFEEMVSACFSDGASSPQEQSLTNCFIGNSSAAGVQAIHSKLDMNTCDVSGSAEEGIFGLRYASIKLTAVTSSVDNLGVGLYLQNGSVAEIDAITDIGSAVNAIELGAIGPTFATFAAFRLGGPPSSAMAYGEGSSVWQGEQGSIDPTPPFPPGSYGNVVVVTTTPYIVQDDDGYLLVDATAGAITIELPAIADNANRPLMIKKIDNSLNNVIVDGDAAETIDGQPTISLLTQYQSISIVAGPTEWSIY